MWGVYVYVDLYVYIYVCVGSYMTVRRYLNASDFAVGRTIEFAHSPGQVPCSKLSLSRCPPLHSGDSPPPHPRQALPFSPPPWAALMLCMGCDD